jgi:site-specific DNA recombinase
MFVTAKLADITFPKRVKGDREPKPPAPWSVESRSRGLRPGFARPQHVLRTGKSGRYRYYTCCTKVRQGETGCAGRTVPMEKLDTLVADHIEKRLLQPQRLEKTLSMVLDRRMERAERRRMHIVDLRKRAAEAGAKLKLKRFFDAIESGVAELSDPMLKDRITELKATRDQARLDAERAEASGRDRASHRRHSEPLPGPPGMGCEPSRRLPPRPSARARPARRSRRKRSSHHGSKKRGFAYACRRDGRKNGGFYFSVPSFVPKWRTRHDSNV